MITPAPCIVIAEHGPIDTLIVEAERARREILDTIRLLSWIMPPAEQVALEDSAARLGRAIQAAKVTAL